MKHFLFILLSLWTSSVVAQTTELSRSEKKDIQVFLQRYLGLSKDEEKLFAKIQILNSESVSEGLSGFAHHDGSYRIEISLKNRSREKVLSTVVHELTHQLYYAIKGGDEDMQLEGVALLGEFLFLQERYGKETALRSFLPMVNTTLGKNHLGLVDFEQTTADYGKSFLFMLFLFENFYQNDFIETHLHSKGFGMSGIAEASLMAKSFRLTPLKWKSPSFLASTFFWSLMNRKNMLTIKQGDLFTQVLSLAKAEIKESIESIVPAFGELIIQNKEFELLSFPAELTGYIVKSDLTKTFVQGHQTALKKDETLMLLNLTDHEISF